MLYTLIARAPTPTLVVPVKAMPLAGDRDSIEEVRATLRNTATAGQHLIEDVGSLSDISSFLRKQVVKAGDHVQIVGHARSGRLELGTFWTGYDTFAGNVFVITADVARNIALVDDLHPEAKVWLIGCAVAQEPIDDEADGPSLLFQLAREWSCPVSGTVDFVGPGHFDKTGRYSFPDRLVTAAGRRVSKKLPPLSVPSTGAIGTLPPLTKFIYKMTYLGRRDTAAMRARVAEAWRKRFPALEIRQCASEVAPIGLPEAVAVLNDGSIATFSSGGTLIKIIKVKDRKTGKGVFYTPVNAKAFQADLRTLFDEL